VFNIGPLELVVLALVAIVVFGPERLPQLARDAAQLIRGLREVAKGAQTQLRDELGPEFADVDLRNLHPRTALRKALLGDDLDLGVLDPRAVFRDAVTDPPAESSTPAPAAAPNGTATAAPAPAPVPPAPPTATAFDTDAT
jgi:sec-independent protein translocase protein TatB